MTLEKNLYVSMRKGVLAIEPDAHIERVENAIKSGTPDVNLCLPWLGEAWLELKRLNVWPVRPSTRVAVVLRDMQRHWLLKRLHAHGKCGVLVQIDRTVLLYDTVSAIECLGAMDTDGMIASASWNSSHQCTITRWSSRGMATATESKWRGLLDALFSV